MLVRVDADGLVYYCSPRLAEAGVPHAFSTRLGGVSPAPFESLNLGSTISPTLSDDPTNVRENYRRLLTDLGCDDRQWVYVHQVHGNVVADAHGQTSFECGQFADAIVSDDVTRIISVRTADCVPILLADKRGRFVSAVHAGWRGVIAGTLLNAIDRLTKTFDVSTENLVAAIGPCIGPKSMEVGPEVLAEFTTAFGADAPIRRAESGKGLIDLSASIRLQLAAAGISGDRVDSGDHCTVRDADEFFSHRRDAGRTGRMAAVIGPRAPGTRSSQ
jgi:polyphenol oxidase